MRLFAAGLTDVGLKRAINQDSFILAQLPLGGESAAPASEGECAFRFGGGGAAGMVYAVADGLGGGNAGEVASEMALRELARECDARLDPLINAPDEVLPELFRRMLAAINEAIFESAKEGGKEGMATTLTALVIFGDRACWLQSGDSRLYRKSGYELELLTPLHSTVGMLYQGGEIDEEQARSHPYKNVINQCLGGKPGEAFRPAIELIEIEPGDAFLLCTDGLTDGLWNEQIGERLGGLADGRSPMQVARKLVLDAKRASGVDNITGLVVHAAERGSSGGILSRASRGLDSVFKGARRLFR